MKQDEHFFQEQPKFRNMNQTLLLGILKGAKMKIFRFNEEIYRIGESAEKIYYVKEGQVTVSSFFYFFSFI